MRDLGNIAGDVDELRNQRNARKNPPQYAAGQGDDADWSFFDEDSNSSSSMDESSYRGSEQNNFNSSDINALGGNNYNNMSKEQLAKSMTSQEDKFIEMGIKVGKVAFDSSKELIGGVKSGLDESNPFFWTVYGKRVMSVGSIITIIGLIFTILGKLTTLFSGGFWMFIGGVFLIVIGLVVFSCNYDNSKDYLPDDYQGSGNLEDSGGEVIDLFEDSGFNDEGFDEEIEEDNPWGSFGEIDEDGGFEEVVDDNDFSSIWGNLDEIEDTEDDYVGVYEEDINIDSAIDSIREIPPHTQTRQYLFEEFSKVLPLKNPDFAKLKSIPDDSKNFLIFDKILRDAAIQVGTKEDKLPELQELRENQFIIQVKSTRPTGLKEEDIAKEIANIYSRDEYGAIVHPGVYATTSSVGGSYIINIFKGENSLVTLADAYREEKEFVLDPSVRKPIIIGVNELGRVHKFDAEKVYSYIVSGKPRSGKSWLVVALVSQLCMYSSPKEVTIEALDAKGSDSDYYSMKDCIPHFKNFESDPQRILQRLRYLTTVEAERRRKILKEYGVINIADLKEKYRDVDISYHYIVIDEILGLKEKLSKSKDDYNDFKALVNTVVTQMPNLGFRVILVPHRITNDVIPKTTYTLVGFTACVKSEFKEISTALEVSGKEFPYTLCVNGDMALKTSEVNLGNAVFSHGIAVTCSNESNKDMYRFIGSLWNKLEPNTEGNEKSSNKRVEDYKGHNLVGVDSIDDDEDYLTSDDNPEEDFWKDVLGDE